MVFFKKIRLISWLTKAFLNKHGRLVMASFLIGIVGFFLIYKTLPYIPRPKRHVRVAKVGKYTVDDLPEEILKLLSIGLTTISDDGSATPGLAKSWDISDDGLTYTFILQDNLFWQDKTPLNADQVKYSFTDVEQEFLDSKSIRFKLKEPFSPFLTILSKPVFKKDFTGVGPYSIKRLEKSGNFVEQLTLSSKENDLTFRFYPTFEAVILGFKLGEIDEFETLSLDTIDQEWRENLDVQSRIANDNFLAVFFNTSLPLFADKSIRQALAYAIKDKPDGENLAVGTISPQSWAYNADVKLYPFSPDKAKELFKKEDSSDQKEKIKISTNASFLGLAEQIKKSWIETLDLEVEIELINALAPDFQVFLGVLQVPLDPDQYILWHSTREENITKFKSPKIDKLLEDGRKIVDQEQRKEKYFDFQKFLAEECPAVFLSHPTIYQLNRKVLF
ncbi:MAG TPA: ABC transporter substrate-binding protein [Candidatus Bathyarchaeia archaeon]|nr:ABC transporter substrate-binding protein [Candidatus Bathyarchaeia archaeon]